MKKIVSGVLAVVLLLAAMIAIRAYLDLRTISHVSAAGVALGSALGSGNLGSVEGRDATEVQAAFNCIRAGGAWDCGMPKP